MASLPGMPGTLGLPAGTPQGGEGSNPNGGGSIPGSGIVTLVHQTTVMGLSYADDPSQFGTLSIPATTTGNLLVIVVGSNNNDNPPVDPLTGLSSLSFSTNSADILKQAPWGPALPAPVELGVMANLGPSLGVDMSGKLNDWRFFLRVDCWYCTSQGGTTEINWILYNGNEDESPRLNFWIYEFDGYTDWQLCNVSQTFTAPFVDDDTVLPPFPGAPLMGDPLGNRSAYVAVTYIADEDFPHPVEEPWILELEDNYSYASAYTIGVGVQEPIFSCNVEAGLVWIMCASFGPGTGDDTGGDDDVNENLPNTWLVT